MPFRDADRLNQVLCSHSVHAASILKIWISVELQSQDSQLCCRFRIEESVPLMNRLIQAVLLLCSLGMLALVFSCGWHETTLESITINPTDSTLSITGASPAILAAFPTKFTAYGHFIHPPETKDISSQVTWTSNAPLASVDSVGNVTATGIGCGGAVITATAGKNIGGNLDSDAIVTQSATFTVVDTTDPNCGGSAQPTLIVNEAGTGSGTVISSPAGIDCISNVGSCAATFTSGTQVALTAAPAAGSTFAGWSSNCPSTGATTCQIDVTSSVNVIATFN